MEKDEDINWVRTNLRTGKNHSAERKDTLRGSYTVIPRLAARKLYGIRAESARNLCRFSAKFVRFCKVSCDMYRRCSFWYALLTYFQPHFPPHSCPPLSSVLCYRELQQLCEVEWRFCRHRWMCATPSWRACDQDHRQHPCDPPVVHWSQPGGREEWLALLDHEGHCKCAIGYTRMHMHTCPHTLCPPACTHTSTRSLTMQYVWYCIVQYSMWQNGNLPCRSLLTTTLSRW